MRISGFVGVGSSGLSIKDLEREDITKERKMMQAEVWSYANICYAAYTSLCTIQLYGLSIILY